MANPRHLLHAFSTFAVGGPEVRSCDLINHFGERYRHTIVAMDGRYDCRAKLQPGVPVTYLEVQNFRQNLLKNVRQFSRLLKQLKPDVECSRSGNDRRSAGRHERTREIRYDDARRLP